MNKHCFTCGGNGFKDKTCPECGREPLSLNLHARNDVPEFISKAKDIKIPDQYLGVEWSKEMLLRGHNNKLNDQTFIKYCEQLCKVHNMFVDGLLPSKSGIIVAPATYSKVTFAYSCMQFALSRGFTVAELLDTVEVKRLMVLASENPRYKLYGKIDYDEYLMSDVMFVTVTKTPYYSEAYSIVQELLDRRSRKGLSTFFISRFNLDDMSRRDYQKQFSRIQDFNGTENSLKYPAIIQYWEGLLK